MATERAPDVVEGTMCSLYDDPHQYELMSQMTAPPDLPLYTRLVEEAGGPLLELACGTGRVCLQLARRGISTTGIDLSEPMLAFARERALALGLDSELLMGDMRGFHLGDRTFPVVILPYNAFNHLMTLDDVRGCLDSVTSHMSAGSRFVIDTFNPDPTKLLTKPGKSQKLLEYIDPSTRQRIRLFEQTRYEPATQVNHIVWRYEVAGEGDVRVDELSMRIFFPQELDALLQLNGLVIERKIGDYDGCAFESCKPKQIVVCRKR